ncbi:MAG: tRNA adenosine(34) deaminase TadA [Candidatus Aminicenantes bacterium]
MKKALEMAGLAYQQQEVPVGAVVVLDNHIIGSGYNSVIKNCDPTGHAEIVALRTAGEKTGNYRIVGADVYVTLEPCLMCYAAMVHARINHLFFAASDNKTGIFSSGAFEQIKSIFNHTIAVKSGIMLEASSKLLRDFFQERRERRGAGVVERGGLENR